MQNEIAKPELQRIELDLVNQLNRQRLDRTGPESDLESRIQSFELAFRMQTEAPEPQEIDGESEATKRLYGLDDEILASLWICGVQRRFGAPEPQSVWCFSIPIESPIKFIAIIEPFCGLRFAVSKK